MNLKSNLETASKFYEEKQVNAKYLKKRSGECNKT